MNEGSGLVLTVAKIMAHLQALYNAVAYEWPMTGAAAQAELQDALRHTEPNRLIIPEWLTAPTRNALEEWINNIHGLQRRLADLEPESQLHEASEKDTLRDEITSAWNILAELDYELTGIRAVAGDVP